MPRYYTYRKQAQASLRPGETLAFAAGKGYYAKSVGGSSGYSTGAYGAPRAISTAPPTAPRAGPAPPPNRPGPATVTPPPDTPTPPPGTYGQPIDWRSYIDSFGMPDDVKNQLDQIFRGGGDINNLIQVALGYVRGTPWYAQTYPGITEGIARGIVSDEKGYRAYLNDASQLYQQYYGRTIGGDEFANILRLGIGSSLLHAQLEAHADAEAYGARLPADLFSPDELQQIGMEQAGIGNAQGKELSDLSAYAQQVNPIVRQYLGRNLSRAELEGYYGQQLPAQTIAQQFAGKAYTSAYSPDIQFAIENFGGTGGQPLADDQLKTLGEEQAGLDTDVGQRYKRAFEQAVQRMQGAFRGSTAGLSLNGFQRIGSDVGR